MSLILAIEPNKNQAHQLNALVRQHLKAELVTAPTAAAAIAALGDRIPDLVLTPALFGLRDEAALTDRLRQLGSDGSHVQTLAIPILAASSRGGGNNSLLGRKKDKSDPNVGCDPAVFADQIKIYLQRASVERRAQASEVTARAMSAPPRSAANADAPAAADDDLSSFMVGADEFDVDSLEIPSIDPPAAPPPAQQEAPAVAHPAPESEDAQNRRSSAKPNGRQAPSPVEEELGLVTPPASGPPLWRVTESIDDFYSNSGEFEAKASNGGQAPAPAAAAPSLLTPPPAAHKGATANSVAKSAAPPASRPRRTPPQPDEWGYFDATQSSFKALIRRLDEIAGSAA
jgi:CheY-like chemotaxis protein